MNEIFAIGLAALISAIIGFVMGFFWKRRLSILLCLLFPLSSLVSPLFSWNFFTQSGVWTNSHSIWLVAYMILSVLFFGIPSALAALVGKWLQKKMVPERKIG